MRDDRCYQWQGMYVPSSCTLSFFLSVSNEWVRIGEELPVKATVCVPQSSRRNHLAITSLNYWILFHIIGKRYLTGAEGGLIKMCNAIQLHKTLQFPRRQDTQGSEWSGRESRARPYNESRSSQQLPVHTASTLDAKEEILQNSNVSTLLASCPPLA